MADYGVDRYGKPQGYDQQANPYKQRQAAPGTQAPQPPQPQDQANGASAQQPQNIPAYHPPPQGNVGGAMGAVGGMFGGGDRAAVMHQQSQGPQSLSQFALGAGQVAGNLAQHAAQGQQPSYQQQVGQAASDMGQQMGGAWNDMLQHAGSNLKNTGVSGYAPGGQPAPQPQQNPMQPNGQPDMGAQPAAHYNTHLMEGDPAKLADPNHAAKSPKYDFLQAAQSGKYNYDQMGQMVNDLQHGANGRLWQGWGADNKGNLVFQGDPSQLAPEWNGAHRVDAVGSYGNLAQGKDPQGWRWGVEGPPGQGAPQGGQVPLGNPNAPPPTNYAPPPTPGAPGGGAPAPGGFSPTQRVGQLPNTPLPEYTPSNITQFAAPNQSDIEGQQKALLQKVLANPHSMTDQGVNMLKQQSIEEQMAMQKQMAGQMGQQFAGRGMGNSGAQDAGNRRLFENMGSSVLGSNRAIDLSKMQQDRSDELGALGASDSMLGNQMSRATQGYNTGLAGQMAQAGENQTGYNSKADAVKFALQNALNQQNLNLQGQGLDLQGRGLDIQQQQVGNQNAQFGLSNDLANRQFGDAMKQWRARLGFDYNQGALNANQSFWQ